MSVILQNTNWYYTMLEHHSNYRLLLEKLCQYIFDKQFKKAEHLVLEFVSELLLQNGSLKVEESKILHQAIYVAFNCYYVQWLNKQGIKAEKETKKLQSLKHNNYLIAHSSMPAEMDDLLFEAGNYLESKDCKEELLYQLNCYKKNSSTANQS